MINPMQKMQDLTYNFYCCGGAKDPTHPMHDPSLAMLVTDGSYSMAYERLLRIAGERTAQKDREGKLETGVRT